MLLGIFAKTPAPVVEVEEKQLVKKRYIRIR